MRRVSALLAILAVATLGVDAHAQSATERARAAYAEGEARSRARDYPAAARAFAEADALAPNDTALEAALEAALLADDPVLGMGLVERSERSPSASELRAVSRARASFEGRAGVIVVPCVVEAPPCEAKIDGGAVTAPRSWVGVGAHRVSLRQAGRELEESVTVAPRAPVEVRFPAVEAPAPAPAPGPAPLPPAEDDAGEASGLSPWWFVAGCGVTIVLGTVTVAHGVAASSAHDDFDEANGRADRATLEALASDGQSLDTRTNVFLIASLAAGAGTAALGLFAVDWSGGGGARASVSPGPDGVRLRAVGTF